MTKSEEVKVVFFGGGAVRYTNALECRN